MYPNSKFNCLACVAMTIIITVTSTTTATISHTNTTNTTLSATASSTSTDVKTEMTVVARTAAASLSETSAVQLANIKTTRTGFSIPTNSTRVASFTTNITPAAAAAASETITTTTTTTTTTTLKTTKTKTTTSSKNSTITISTTTTTHPKSTNINTNSSVQGTVLPTITEPPPPPNIKIPTEEENTIYSNTTSDLSTITNDTNTIISVSKNSLLLDSLVSKVGDSERIVYANISNGGKFDSSGSLGTLFTKRSSINPNTSKTNSQPPKNKISSSDSDTIKNSSQAAQPKTDNSGTRWTSSASSPSLSSSWRQISPLRRKHAGKALPHLTDDQNKKHNADYYKKYKGLADRDTRTKRSTLSGQLSLIHLKIKSPKLWGQLEAPSKFGGTKSHLHAAPSIQKTPSEIKVVRPKQSKFQREQEEDNNRNILTKDYTIPLEDRKTKSNIFHLSSDRINQRNPFKDSGVNQKNSVSTIAPAPQEPFSWRVCRFCRWISEGKHTRAFRKSQYHKKRLRRSLNRLGIKPTRTDLIHPAKTSLGNLDYNQNTKEIPLLAEISKDDVIPSDVKISESENNKLIFDGFPQTGPLPVGRGRKEIDSFHVISTKHSKSNPTENTSLVDGNQPESELYIKLNFTNNTKMALLVFPEQNFKERNSINTSSDVDNTFHTKDRNCDNKLCSVLKPELLDRPKQSTLKPSPILTSVDTLKTNNKDNHNQISSNQRSKNDFNSFGFTFGESTQGIIYKTGKAKPKKDFKVYHTTYNKTSAGQRHGALNGNYDRNHFKNDAGRQRRNSEIKSTLKFLRRRRFGILAEKKKDPQLDTINQEVDIGVNSGYPDNEDQRRILIEKKDDVFTRNGEGDVVDEEKDKSDDEKWDDESYRTYFDDNNEHESTWDRSVHPDPFHNPRNAQRLENERKERELSWLKNAYESISYRQSHDFFLDPEFEQKRLERKVLGRWKGHPWSNWQQGLGSSTHTGHTYLPSRNTQPHRNYPPTISDHDITNALQFERVESRPSRRTKRSTLNYEDKTIEPFDNDIEKPCGNHGRHRSHVGGMHHLTRHQRRDVHRVPRARHRYPRDVRFPSVSQNSVGDAFGKAAYLSGVRELMQLRVKKRLGLAQELIPRQHFTIELWIKPEGGQSNPTVILGLFDVCHQGQKAKGWSVGIRTYEEGQEADARIYFSLETDRASSPSVLMSDRTYEPNRWVHVAASYTGKKMNLYINTALVGVQNLQTGDIFSVSASSCKEIFLGGKPYSKEKLYRGSVDQILLWNFPLKHGDVVQNMFDARLNMDREKGIVFKESFDDLSQWKSVLKGQPELHISNIEDYRYDIQLVAPPCGRTVCDDPDVIRSYVQHSELRQEKKVRYRIVNVMDNNEENPKVSKFQTVAQHRALVAAFKQYNISWELEEVKLRNTSLRHKTVLLDCLPIQIGDKHCNRECQHTQTGNDGGDCDPDEIPCDAINLGNGRCDFECNRAYYEWDRGDCCKSPFKSANSTCLDPDSPHRIYLSMNEYKTALNVNGSTHLNVYLASWSLKGLATFPWEKHVYDVLGGTVVDTNSFGQPGKMDGLIHEFGHNLGLWHVHHGISEVKCDDPCMENEPSLELGDLCSDTAPTAQNTHCRDPDWTVQACGISPFKNTPYRNYMSYASGNCTNHFTPQQVARMHCYLDLVYQPWLTTMKPSPVPLPPKVVAATLDSVTFVWLPGLGDNVYGSHSECHKCTQDGALIQYASSARAPSDSRKKLHWSKEEALGPPDAERCKASSLSWMQETYECKSKCYIEFMFKYNTVPQSISIWVVWRAAVGIKNVKFYFMDGSTDSLGPIQAFCDMPFTANLNYTKKVKKVRIYPNNTYVGIDAIQLISTPESARICSSCRPTKYRVMRSPDFPRPVYTSDTMYTDGSVMRGVNYSYTIQVNIGNKVSGPSPALHYQHGQPFCGNGRVETNLGERCDDGNVNDGDGCTADCEVEQFYRCKGTPSLCYRHDGDGICEEDEQNTSLRDCGYHTPEGYDDQWPVSAIGNPRYQMTPECSEDVLIGAPTRIQVCKNNVELSDTWRPCNTNYFDAHDYWVKVYYARPVIAVGVVIYLGSDGRTYDSPEPKIILVQLIDTDDRVTYVEHKLIASCQSNPIYISILHDLSRPFFRTKGVKLSLSSSNIAIAGIRLRASHHFDPITPESCSQEQFYNPRSQQCVNQTCPRKFCDQLITENANTTCTGRGEGDICQITCLDGYRIKNELDEVICADGVWRRSNEVSCIPVDCTWPAMVHATFICPRGTTFKQTCSFRCNPPAQLQGSGSMVTCESDGRWSMVNAYCLAFCHTPIEHPNAYPASRSCQIEKAHQAGSRCKYRCEKGYHIEGMPAKRRSLHLTCKDSGQWEGKQCVRVTCKKIPPEFTGMYTCTESTYGGSWCILKCPTEPRAQKIKCLQKGIWNSHFKMCKFPKSAKCPTPLLMDHRAQLRKCSNRSAGSTCEVTCKSQAYQPALPHMNGTVFDNKDRTMKLTCTGMLKWLPNPRHISCKGTCRVMSLKDGWCDSSNNRFFCAWDKGDCCASTVEGGKIRLDKPTCKSKCACKDPNAKENTNKSKK